MSSFDYEALRDVNKLSCQPCGCDESAGYLCARHYGGPEKPHPAFRERPYVPTATDGLGNSYALDRAAVVSGGRPAMQTFDSGATRNDDSAKYDYEGFVHPEALHAYGEYMHQHRLQRDGSVRDSDNWQKGIPFRKYVKSLVRHSIDLWRMERGFTVINPDTGSPHTRQELCCAILFNSFGYLKELVDPAPINKEQS